MKEILLFIWQFPQNIVGLIILLVNIRNFKKDSENSIFRVKHLCDSGISLGNYIIIDLDSNADDLSIRHERGHQKQSLRLGWLYLLIIGLPSATGNIIDRVFHKNWKISDRLDWYYNKQPWERGANKLGGVTEDYNKQIENLRKNNN